jgi:hypothetical protein
VLIPLIVAGIVAYVLDPVVVFLERRGMSRMWSVILAVWRHPHRGDAVVAAVLPASSAVTVR